MTAPSARFTRADYDRLPEGFPAELIDGALVKEPSPSPGHQRLVARVYDALHGTVAEECIFFAPLDVFLDELNVLQPDVLVLHEADVPAPEGRVEAAPALVVEVLSPATAGRDRAAKAGIYLRAGVSEVWLVDPERRTIEVRTAHATDVFAAGRPARSTVLPAFRLAPDDLFGA